MEKNTHKNKVICNFKFLINNYFFHFIFLEYISHFRDLILTTKMPAICYEGSIHQNHTSDFHQITSFVFFNLFT